MLDWQPLPSERPPSVMLTDTSQGFCYLTKCATKATKAKQPPAFAFPRGSVSVHHCCYDNSDSSLAEQCLNPLTVLTCFCSFGVRFSNQLPKETYSRLTKIVRLSAPEPCHTYPLFKKIGPYLKEQESCWIFKTHFSPGETWIEDTREQQSS